MRTTLVGPAALLTAIALCLTGGCGEAADDPADLGPRPDGGVQDLGAPPCDGLVRVVAATASVEPSRLFTVLARGGSGAYRFDLAENASGASINERSGAYLSGPTGGVTDRVRVRDELCPGEASIAIRVVEPMQVVPDRATVPPGTSWRFEVVGGSGRFEFRPVRLASGAALAASGDYEAGARSGVDRLEVLDLATGQTVEARVEVRLGVVLRAVPETALIGMGQSFELELVAGSGEVVAENLPAFLDQTGPRTLTARGAGRARLRLQDRFTGQRTEIQVVAADPRAYPATRSGDLVHTAVVLGPGSLIGDAAPDLILGLPDADEAAANGGAVFVYAGRTDGAGAELLQVIPGAGRGDQLGFALAVADLDRDGRPDLVAGSPFADLGAEDAGLVQIFRGREGGGFEPTASGLLGGRLANDQLGRAVAACDFDTDGWMDLAVGVLGAEDRSRTVRAFDQGAVFVFRGSEAGFSSTPDQIVWGDLPDSSGAWGGISGLRYGWSLAAGDVDGDQTCDLVVGTPEWEPSGERDVGLVAVHRGKGAAATEDGLLGSRPDAVWATLDPTDGGAQLGRQVRVADLDGDGRAEVVATQHGHGAGGAVRVFRGTDAFPSPFRIVDAAEAAAWSYIHLGNGDNAGWSIDVGDIDGDGRMDLAIGNLDDEVGGGPNGAGTVYGFRAAGGPRLLEMSPTWIHGGVRGLDRLGSAVAVVGDLSGDGAAELVAWAGTDDRYGSDVGAPYVLGSEPGSEPTALELPGAPSGAQFARALDIVGDVDGDGFADLVVGAPSSGPPEVGRASGLAYLYRGQSGGAFEADPSQVFAGFFGHSTADELGYAVSRLGDFDGDGVDDLAVAARLDDLPAGRDLDPARFEVDPACPTGGAANVGAVYVFRGSRGGLPAPEPALIVYGSDPGDGLLEVRGGFDFDGDGRGDLALAAPTWDRTGASNAGGVALVLGRRPVGFGRVSIVCSADFRWRGRGTGDGLGSSVAALGDLDQDGCDEIAVGAPGYDGTNPDEGEVLVLFGAGGAGCPSQPRMLHLRSGASRARAGGGLAGGPTDVDGDGRPDLAVGMPNYDNGEVVGAAALVRGAWLARLPTEPAQDEAEPTAVADFLRASAGIVFGDVANAQAGAAVALLRAGDRGLIVVGAPAGGRFGEVASGTVVAHAIDGNGAISGEPWFAFSGETVRPSGGLGASVAVGSWGESRPAVLVVGGPTASGVAPENGAAYAFSIESVP